MLKGARKSPPSFLGFTLTELVIVLLILAILSAVVIPYFLKTLLRSQLNACTEQVASHLRYVRRLAMETGVPKQMTFYVGDPNQSYRVHAVGNPAALEKNPLDGSDFIIMLVPAAGERQAPQFKGVQFREACFAPDSCTGAATPRYVTFDANGVPFAGSTGTVPLTENGIVELVDNENPPIHSHIYVSKSSGMVILGSFEP